MLRPFALWFLVLPAAWAASFDLSVMPMSEANRALVEPVVMGSTLRREYAARTFRGRRAQFEFLMDNMAECSVLAEALGLIVYRAEQDERGRIIADDRVGARGSIQQVFCAEGIRMYFVEGTQRGVFRARGRGVVFVSFEEASPDTIRYTGQMFVKIDNEIVAALAQLFFAFVKGSVDRHFDHVMNQPIVLSGMAMEQPALLRRCIQSMADQDVRRLRPFLETLREGAGP